MTEPKNAWSKALRKAFVARVMNVRGEKLFAALGSFVAFVILPNNPSRLRRILMEFARQYCLQNPPGPSVDNGRPSSKTFATADSQKEVDDFYSTALTQHEVRNLVLTRCPVILLNRPKHL